ncbi:MAG: class II aldolase/adducin family protein [Albidovulum sp.]|nr:class II aldolase/adducin family protein [Albidovulum sp.]
MDRNITPWREFLELSRKIGCDPLLVQGPGGNTSCKNGGTMFIKASGTKLSSALAQNTFASVDVEKAIAEIDGAGDGTCRAAMTDPSSSVRPSIETTFHALLPQKFVFHYHSVSAICHSIANQGMKSLQRKLEGVNWAAVPYRKPGIPLSKAIRSTISGRKVEAIVLENHGIIVADDSLAQVAALIEDIERRLDLPPRPLLVSSRNEFPELEGWTAIPELSGLLFDDLSKRRVTAGSYYPDHVVFLGPAIGIARLGEFPSPDQDNFPYPAILVEDAGIYIKESASNAQRAMIRCIFDILSRIPTDWTLRPIGPDAEAELLNWDAEKYRQSLAKKH